MADIPAYLHSRIFQVLLRCGPFERHAALLAVFSDARISPWRDGLQETDSIKQRLPQTVDYLRTQCNVLGENGLALFLRVLSEQCDPADTCHLELASLADEFERHISQLGRYERLVEIGHGEFATVYKAYDSKTGQDVALKMLRPQLTIEEKACALFEREANIARRLHHPHIVTVYDYAFEDGRLYIAMELAASTLKDRIAQGALLPEEALIFIQQLAEALDYIHGQQIFHRDLKPSNILLDPQKGVLIGDFGLAKAIQASGTSLTVSKAGAGTAAYMAPEIWDGEPPSPASDVYSLGCVLYEMLTGHILIVSDNQYAVIKLHQGSAALVDRAPNMPERFKLVLRQALERQKEDRYHSASELAKAFECAVQAETAPQSWLNWLMHTMAQAQRKGRWTWLLQLCQAYEATQPGDPRMAQLRQQAEAALHPPVLSTLPAPPSLLVSSAPAAPSRGIWVILTVLLLGVSAVCLGIALKAMPALWRDTPTPTHTLTPAATLTPSLESNGTTVVQPTATLEPMFTSTIAPTATPTRALPLPKTVIPTETPSTPTATPDSDPDKDGMPMIWEVENGLDPNQDEATLDLDADGLQNLEEYRHGTWANKDDSDGDGMSDGWEVEHDLLPTVGDALGDPDGDGVNNVTEFEKKTNPGDADSDDDGLNDGWEVRNGFDPMAPAQAGDIWVRPKDAMTMVYVPAGQFQMGSQDGRVDERPVHLVTLSTFWLDRTEVTFGHYNQCVAAGICANSSLSDDRDFNGSDRPVVGVAWSSAQDYCMWVGGALPTEAQWEYGARGSEGRIYPWGNSFDGTRLSYCDKNCSTDWADKTVDDGFQYTAPVGSFPNGRSWVGAVDMVGNASEWVADWYGPYLSQEQVDPKGATSGMEKVIRGGGWSDNIPEPLRGADRYGEDEPSRGFSNVGFRCVYIVPLEPTNSSVRARLRF